MKNLLLIVVAVFTMNGLFAQLGSMNFTPPQVESYSVATVHETASNKYYIDFAQYITEGTYPVDLGTGHIDLNVSTKPKDSNYFNGDYSVESITNCGVLDFELVEQEDLGEDYFTVKYRVYDNQGNMSNIGTIIVRVIWYVDPQIEMENTCAEL